MTETETEVKRFVAPSMSKALELVREEMGPEAIILSSQKVANGVEIVTSVERDLPTRGIAERRDFGQNFDAELDHVMASDASWQSQAGIEQAAANYPSRLELNGPDEPHKSKPGEHLAAEIERAREKMFEAKRQAAEAQGGETETQNDNKRAKAKQPRSVASQLQSEAVKVNKNSKVSEALTSPASVDNERKLEDLKGEIADLRMLLEQQLWSEKPVSSSDNLVAQAEDLGQSKVLAEHLARLGINDQLVRAISADLGPVARVSDAWKQCLAKLAFKIPIAKEMDTSAGGVFAFIGPTGVGKTTTLAKLASQFTLANGAGKVALVSMDTHRVGAIEQLKALGRILDAPVRTVSASSSLMTSLAELRNFPLVLIDTAGFRHGDAMLKAQLEQLDQNPAVKRLLVLSSLSQLQTLKASIHAYRPRSGQDACVISKLDEASSLGEALSAVIQHALPVAYLTDGQQIPNDVHIASAHKLVSNAVSLAKQLSHVSSVLN